MTRMWLKNTMVRFSEKMWLSGEFFCFLFVDFMIGNATGVHRGIYALLALTLVPSLVQVGFALSMFGLSKAILNVLAGAICDRIGRKPMMLLGSVICGCGGLLIAISTTYDFLLVGSALMGAGSGMSYVAIMTSMAERVGIKKRGFSMGMFELAAYGGFSIGAAFAGLLAATYGLRMPFYLAFMMPLFAGIISFPFLKETRPHLLVTDGPINWKTSIEEMFKHVRPVIPAYIGGFVSKIADSLAWSFLPVYLSQLHMNAQTVTIVVGSFTASWALSQPFTGYLSDIIGRKMLTVLGLILEAICLLLFTDVRDSGMGIALCLAMGLGTGLYYVALPTTVGDASPLHIRGSMLGGYRFFRDMGYFVGPLLLGAAADAYGLTIIFYLTATFLIFAAAIYFIFGSETLHDRMYLFPRKQTN